MPQAPASVPLVSVVLPTFRRAHLIERAVRNVLSQDYPNLELIVVNDGSPDNTSEILARLEQQLHDARLRVITRENGGLPRALNTGFEAALGELWTWTSDDNAYRPGAIWAMVRELELDPEAVMVFADYQVIHADGSPGEIRTMGPPSDLVQRNVIGACFLYRASAARRVGAYDASRELAEDYDYWVRMAKVGPLRHLNRVLYDYGDEPDSLTRQRALEVSHAAAKVISAQGSRQALLQHMTAMAGQLKSAGHGARSLWTALWLVSRFPLSAAGYWAALRALTPMPLLRASRRLRGIDGR
ncbi:MAG: hypothetical protein ICCCNLDF_01938 [Planctomycetes bacterium]|nr:hypothetical protein [Planctomycetota bacterium]HRJ77666.1 glycosyltransferase [Planctomycetota bacterium]